MSRKKEELFVRNGEESVWVLLKRDKKNVLLKAAFSTDFRRPTHLVFNRDYRPLTSPGRVR